MAECLFVIIASMAERIVMSPQIIRIMHWAARSVAVAALFLAVKPGQALADVGTADDVSYQTEDLVAGAVSDVDVDSEDEDPPALE